MTLREYARRKGVTPPTIRNWIKRGYLDKWVSRATGEAWQHWDIDEAALDFVPTEKRGYNSYSRQATKRTMSKAAMAKLATETTMTLQEIGDNAGVTRERARQILLTMGIVGRDRQLERTKELRAARANQSKIRKGKLEFIDRVVRDVGFRLETIPQSPLVTINGYTCLFRLCKKATQTIRGKRFYYKISLQVNRVEGTDFVIVLLGKSAEKAYVIPTELIMKSLADGSGGRKIFYFPLNPNLPIYNNMHPHIDYPKYEEAWTQLDEPKKKTPKASEEAREADPPSNSYPSPVEAQPERQEAQEVTGYPGNPTRDLNSGNSELIKQALEFFTALDSGPYPELHFWHYKDHCRRYWLIQASKYDVKIDTDGVSDVTWQYDLMCEGQNIYGGLLTGQLDIVPKPEQFIQDYIQDVMQVAVGVAKYAIEGPWPDEPLPAAPTTIGVPAKVSGEAADCADSRNFREMDTPQPTRG